MGAWGAGPLDSDQALDWLGNEVTDHVGGRVKALLYDFHRDRESGTLAYAVDLYAYQLRAAADVVVKLNFFNDRAFGDLHQQLADALGLVLDCREWIEAWSGPDEVVRSIQDQIVQLREGQHSTGLFEQIDIDQGVQFLIGVDVADKDRQRRFRELLADQSDDAFLHDVEKLVALRLHGSPGYGGSVFPSHMVDNVDHGAGVAIAYRSHINR